MKRTVRPFTDLRILIARASISHTPYPRCNGQSSGFSGLHRLLQSKLRTSILTCETDLSCLENTVLAGHRHNWDDHV